MPPASQPPPLPTDPGCLGPAALFWGQSGNLAGPGNAQHSIHSQLQHPRPQLPLRLRGSPENPNTAGPPLVALVDDKAFLGLHFQGLDKLAELNSTGPVYTSSPISKEEKKLFWRNIDNRQENSLLSAEPRSPGLLHRIYLFVPQISAHWTKKPTNRTQHRLRIPASKFCRWLPK